MKMQPLICTTLPNARAAVPRLLHTISALTAGSPAPVCHHPLAQRSTAARAHAAPTTNSVGGESGAAPS
jgi:hypothetical protein